MNIELSKMWGLFSRIRSFSGSCALFLLAGFVTLAWLGLPAVATEEMPPTDAFSRPPDSDSFGDYLVGRFAQIDHDGDTAADRLIRAVDADPGDIELLNQAFNLAVARGRYDDALRLAERLSDREEHPTGLVDLVLVCGAVRDGDAGKVLDLLDGADKTGIVGMMAPLIKAWIFAGNGEPEQALALLVGEAGSITGFEPFMLVHEALIEDFLGRQADASKNYKALVDALQGDDLRIVLAYGNLLQRMDRHDKAIKLYDDYLEDKPQTAFIVNARALAVAGEKPLVLIASSAHGIAEIFFATGQTLAQERSRRSSVVYLRLSLMLRPDFALARFLLANTLEKERELESALREYAAIGADTDLGWDARFEHALLLFRMERGEEAIENLEVLARDGVNQIQVLSALADILRSLERYEEAKGYYDQVIGLLDDPKRNHWALYYARGIAHERSGEWKSAEKDFKAALELEPDQPLVLNYLGYSWVEKGINVNQALEMIEKAVEKRPHDGYIVDSLGWALYFLEEFDEAVGWLEKAIVLQPEDPTINDHLGDAYWRTGRKLEAGFQWRHALTMGAIEEDEAEIRRKLRSGLAKGRARGATAR